MCAKNSGSVAAAAWRVWLASGIAIAAAAAAMPAGASAVGRLAPVSRTAAPASWLSADGPFLASGAGRTWTVLSTDGTRVAEGEFALPSGSAVLGRDRLYFVQGDRVRSLVPGSLDAPAALDVPVEEGASLLVGRVFDYLIVVEQGAGVHLLTLPPPPGFTHPPGHHHHDPHPWPPEPSRIAFVPFDPAVVAVAAHEKTAYLALEEGGVAVLDVADPLAPRVARVLAIPGRITALATVGRRLLLAGDGTLRTFDLESARFVSRVDGIEASAIAVRGRLVHLAQGAGGVASFRDVSSPAVTHVVTLSNFAFSPQNLVIDVGDTVQWNNVQGGHDTDSCDAGQTACPGVSTESWDSGAPALAPWSFSHLFTLAGPNPYTCTLHAGAGMVGSVTVEAAPPPPPPAVPDGDGGSGQVLVTALDSSATSLEIAFDDATCADAGDVQIVGGTLADLPATPGGAYGISVRRCGCGTTSPCVWNPSPSLAPGELIWFVLVATDGSTTEGSWGSDGATNERLGPGPGGSSGECGVTGRDLTNVCGH